MGISGFFGRNNLSKIELKVELAPEIFATAKTPVSVSVTNKRRFLPIFLLRINIQNQELFFPFIEAGKSASKHVDMTFEQRGRHTLGLISLNSAFPFNFFVRYKWYNEESSFVVFPRLQQCKLFSFYEKERHSKGEYSSDTAGSDSDIISIREYVPGDPIKYINWKATARTGELKTKELSSLTFQPVIIDFSTVDIENTEEKISCVTYAIVQLIKKNIPIGLRLGSIFFSPSASCSHRTNLLTELALYGAHES